MALVTCPKCYRTSLYHEFERIIWCWNCGYRSDDGLNYKTREEKKTREKARIFAEEFKKAMKY